MYLLFAPIFVTYLVIINFKEEQNNGILPLIPYTTNIRSIFLKQYIPYRGGYSMWKLQTLDLSYLEINDFLVSHNQYYLDLLKSLEENNLDKNIKAFYQMSSYIINSPLIDNEKTINTFVQNVKSNLAYSNENKVYNVIFKKNEWTEKYDFGLKLNINPLNKETLISLYRPGQINNNLSSKTYVNTIKEQLLIIFLVKKKLPFLNNIFHI
ncbi:hypothetical protein [Spiroplasma endosymbiont of Ammophila pubescens]|uniref:hypothetical protein n=1 Tax=Spiroplasma endosymbiont of Ammophila pubescens TaxID=3066315 RepID=UPI0032B261BD